MTASHANGEPAIPVVNPLAMELDEYPSPAFMKRARLSYGALFEGGDDKFEEDGGAKGKGRKRTRFGRESSSWRYTSQSPSPTPEAEPETPAKTTEAAVEVDMQMESPPKPQMADEGCQTMELEPAPTPAPAPTKEVVSESQPAEDLRREVSPDKPSSTSKDQREEKSPFPQAESPSQHQEDKRKRPSPVPKPAESVKHAVVQKPSSSFGSNTLFGSFAPSNSGYDSPRFGTSSPIEADGGWGIANQVRFGFSHTPQTSHPPPSQPSHSAPAPFHAGQGAYPESHLEPSDPTKYADMETYVDQAEQEMETEPQYAYDGLDLNPPATESFGAGQWDMATQSQDYNPVEGGHFGADALDEGTRITGNGYALHNDAIDVDKVPPGFASFGGHEDQIREEDMEDEDDEEQPYIPGEDFVENDELEDDLDDEVALEDRDETEYGPDGEIIEQGDYDQRQYNIPEEDDDELSEEEHNIELEASARDNEPDLVEEDKLQDDRMGDQVDDDEEESGEEEYEQGSYQDEEQGIEYEDDQGSFDDDEDASSFVSEESEPAGPDAYQGNTSQRWMQPPARPAPATSKGPVVIDLLSDSDEDDDPPPRQAKPASAEPSAPMQQDQTPSGQNLNAGDQHDAVLEPSPGPEQRPAQGRNQMQQPTQATAHEENPESASNEGSQSRTFSAGGERRVSSGSHLYGENAESPKNDSNVELHLPSTPPPDRQGAAVNADIGMEKGMPPPPVTRADATYNDDDNDDAYPESISFNGASDSHLTKEHDERVVPAAEPEQYSPSKPVSNPIRAAGGEDVGAAKSEHDKRDIVVAGQEVDLSEDHNMADTARQQVSSPLRLLADGSNGDADETEAVAESADVTEPDEEVERLFEEVEVSDDDVVMGESEVDVVPPPDATETAEPPRKSSPLAEHSAESRGEHAIPGFLRTGPEHDISSHERTEFPQVTSSSPVRSQSFASQVFSSSPSKEEYMVHLPIPLETQPGQAVSQPELPFTQMEVKAPIATVEMTVEKDAQAEDHVIQIQDDEDDVSEPDVSMMDAVVEGGDLFPEADESLALAVLDSEEEMDIENQITQQLEFDIMRTTTTTTVEHAPGRLTVVQQTQRVTISHAGGGSVSNTEATHVLDQAAEQSVEDVPIEPASLHDVVQEELMLQDLMQAEFGAQAPDLGDDDEMDSDEESEDDLEQGGSIENEYADDVAGESGGVEDEDDGPLEEEIGPAAITAQGSPQKEVTADDAHLEESPGLEAATERRVREESTLDGEGQGQAGDAEDEEKQGGSGPLASEESVESTIDVVPDEDVIIIGEDDAPAQPDEPRQVESEEAVESTVDVVPDGNNELLPEENILQQQETGELPEVSPTRIPHKHQAIEVLVRPQTRSLRSRSQQAQSLGPAPSDHVAVPDTTKEVSPKVSKPATRSRKRRGQPSQSVEPTPSHEGAALEAAKEPSPEVSKATTRTRKARGQASQSVEPAPSAEVAGPETTGEPSPDVSKVTKRTRDKTKEPIDPSIELARASIQKRGGGKKRQLEELSLSPRLTRQRSTSIQPAASSELVVEEDSSVALAKEALNSPSRKRAKLATPEVDAPSSVDLVRRLRTILAEFTPLKTLRHQKKSHPHILAVVACDPPEPHRTKHRDYHTTVTITDASVAPDQAVEVHFKEMHSAFLPAVKQGDTIMLRDFEIVPMPGKDFALKQRGQGSSWAVYDAHHDIPGGSSGADCEMEEAVAEYLRDLRAWYPGLDQLDREKLVTAMAKMAELGDEH